MIHNIDQAKNGDLLTVKLTDDETLKCQSSALMGHSAPVSAKTTTARSIFKVITSLEDFPITTINAKYDESVVLKISPWLPGEIQAVTLTDPIKIQSIAYVASYNCDLTLSNNNLYKDDKLSTMLVKPKSNDDASTVFYIGYQGVDTISLSENETTYFSEDHLAMIDTSVDLERVEQKGLREKVLDAYKPPMLKAEGSGKIGLHVRSILKQKRILSKL